MSESERDGDLAGLGNDTSMIHSRFILVACLVYSIKELLYTCANARELAEYLVYGGGSIRNRLAAKV